MATSLSPSRSFFERKDAPFTRCTVPVCRSGGRPDHMHTVMCFSERRWNIPVVVTDGTHLTEPTAEDFAANVGA